MIPLVVATPVIRPWNLERLRASIAPGREYFDLAWLVALDGTRLGTEPRVDLLLEPWITLGLSLVQGKHGERHLNAILDALQDDTWFYGVADDNIVQPGFFAKAHEVIVANPHARAIMFGQRRPGPFYQPATPKNLKAGEVDGGQCLVRKSLIGNLRYGDGPVCDGDFYEALWQKSNESWVFVNEPLTSHNALR